MTFESFIRRERIKYAYVNFWHATLDCRCYGQHLHENESRTEIRCEPFVRAVLVLDKTCSYKWYSLRLIILRRVLCKTRLSFPRINGPNVSRELAITFPHSPVTEWNLLKSLFPKHRPWRFFNKWSSPRTANLLTFLRGTYSHSFRVIKAVICGKMFYLVIHVIDAQESQSSTAAEL